MPTFVIQTLGRPASKVTVDASTVRIGRDEANDVVLPDDTVSRSHAVITRGAEGWSVGCVSETNSIVVDGVLARQSAPLREGSEILVGSAFLLIFCEDPAKAEGYVDTKTVYQRSRCAGCGWEGMVLKARKDVACPACKGTAFVEVGSYAGEARRALGSSDPPKRLQTAALDPEMAKKMLRTIKAAKGSHLARVVPEGETSPRVELSEDKPLVIARGEAPPMDLRGFAFGSVTVAWDGRRFKAESAMIFPAMKVNGEKKTSAALSMGDVISLGGNVFRFVTE